jgi:hypothetical protein
MPVYGLQTFKSNGTTTVLQNSTKSGVFAQTYTVPSTVVTGTAVAFSQYTGRTLRIFQLRPGAHSWSISYPSSVPTITFTKNPDPATVGASAPQFYYSTTVLYIFVR